MAPLRRYLRITKYSVLEVRIYLDRPADAETWLLKRDNPALPRVIQAIRPLVLPKLREENERGKAKGGAKARKKGVKDVVVEDDFEVSIFLTELSSRHSVLTKQKDFKDKARIQSNSSKLTNWLTTGTSEQPLIINEEAEDPILIREEDDENEAIKLADVPEADVQQKQSGRSSRVRRTEDEQVPEIVSDASEGDYSDLFVPKLDPSSRPADHSGGGGDLQEDNKKKFDLKTSYDGFSIYGRILCLVVKRRGVRHPAGRSGADSGQAMLENWVSTQAAAEQAIAEED